MIKISVFLFYQASFWTSVIIEYIQANNRNQLGFYCLEEVIEADHPARFTKDKKERLQNPLRSTPSRMKKPLTRGAFYLGIFHLPG